MRQYFLKDNTEGFNILRHRTSAFRISARSLGANEIFRVVERWLVDVILIKTVGIRHCFA